MWYGLAADAVVVAHGLFVLFVIFGGLFALRWPKAALIHLPALVWGVIVEVFYLVCPLTPLEIHLRQQAGLAGYEGGFIEHYILPLLYPPGLTENAQLLLGFLLLLFNVIIYSFVLLRDRARRRREESV